MVNFSKKTLKLKELHERRKALEQEFLAAALDGKGHRAKADALARVHQDIHDAEQEPEVYTCAQCGKDFEHHPNHVDMLVASFIFFDGDGEPTDFRDYGIEHARRVKICQPCADSWAIHLKDYIEMR